MPRKRKLVGFRVDEELIEKAKKLAELENRSFSNYLESLLLHAVEDFEKEKGEKEKPSEPPKEDL